MRRSDTDHWNYPEDEPWNELGITEDTFWGLDGRITDAEIKFIGIQLGNYQDWELERLDRLVSEHMTGLDEPPLEWADFR